MSQLNKEVGMDSDSGAAPAYEPPAVTVLGSVHELTQACDKVNGSADGFTYHGDSIVCRSS